MQSYPGCLPESNVIYDESADAIAASNEMADEYRDSGDYEEVISDNEIGFHQVVITKEVGSGFMIEVSECDQEYLGLLIEDWHEFKNGMWHIVTEGNKGTAEIEKIKTYEEIEQSGKIYQEFELTIEEWLSRNGYIVKFWNEDPTNRWDINKIYFERPTKKPRKREGD